VSAGKSHKFDFERGMPRVPVVTTALIVSHVVFFIVLVAFGFLESKSSILQAGALSRHLVLQGEVWRLFTMMFLHFDVEHLFTNAVALFLLGSFAEHVYGKREMAALYFISGLGGSLLSICNIPGPSIGASGAIFGLMGAMIVFIHKYRNSLYIRNRNAGGFLVVWAAYSVVGSYFDPFVDNAAHVGGLLSGALVGYRLTPRLIKSMDLSATTVSSGSKTRPQTN
jgi:rhomboid protease GluP